jgi:hypothetical protein
MYLLQEVLWIAVAIAVTRMVVSSWTRAADGQESLSIAVLLFPAAVLAWSIAIGGLFGRLALGAISGVVLICISVLVFIGALVLA